MYCWVDDFRKQAIQTFPTLRNYIDQCCDMGDIEPLMEFLMALVLREDNFNH